MSHDEDEEVDEVFKAGPDGEEDLDLNEEELDFGLDEEDPDRDK